MYSNVLRRAVAQVVFRPNVVGTKAIAVASFHTSSPSNDALGEMIQRLRFRFYHDPRHHLDYDKWAKVFAVEGNVKSGKSEFAEEFAKRLDLRYFPACDYTYVLTAKERLVHPEEVEFLMDENHVWKRMRDVSLDRIYKNPEDWGHIARYQYYLMKAKFYQYADAVAHLISTGQGVVIDRSFYSLPVFEHAFKRMKWLDRGVIKYLHDFRLFMQQHFIPPQVVLYLDVPAEDCHKELQKGTPIEQLITLEYMKAMEEGYSKYLVEAERFGSKVIRLDWSKDKRRDAELVIMDMDEMETLELQNCKWDISNTELKKMMKIMSDNVSLSQMSYMTCPIEEMNEPSWGYFAMPIYNKSRPWYKFGYDPRDNKWAFLKEQDYKGTGYIL